MILDSGNRREFSTGAVRDIEVGKGRCDLMPILDVGALISDVSPLRFLGLFIENKDLMSLRCALLQFVDSDLQTDLYTVLLDVSKHYEDGAKKYGEHNWEKGIPAHSFVDSAVRHYLKFRRGDDDEPHGRAFIWNILGLMWTIRNKPEMNDLWEGRDD